MAGQLHHKGLDLERHAHGQMGMPDQRHQRLGAVPVPGSCCTVDSRTPGQLRQRQDHDLALAGQRRVLDKGVVQPAFVLGVGHRLGGAFGVEPVGGSFCSSRARSSRLRWVRVAWLEDRSAPPAARAWRAPTKPAMRRMARADRSARSASGICQAFDLFGLLDDAVHRLLADLGVGIDQQRRHRGDVQRLHQPVADLLAQRACGGRWR